MISRYEAYMDGVALSSIDPSIYVLNLQPGDPVQNIVTRSVAGRPGARVTKRMQNSTSETVVFEIHEYDTVKRNEICRKIQKWADGKVLSVSDRPTQQMRCVCSSYPKVNAREWTESLAVSFVAYNPPYWEDKNETVIRTTSSKKALVPGNAPGALVSADITVGSSISSLTVTAGDKSIVLDYSLSQGNVVHIGYDDNGILYIRKGSVSIIKHRTAASDDDLIVPCGEWSTFSVSSTGSLSAVFRVRGCWR